MNRRTLLLAAVAALLAYASTWLLREPREAPPAPEAQRTMDYFLGNFSAMETGPDGRLRQRLDAAHLNHYTPDGTSDMEDPRLWVYEDGKSWQASAARAISENQNTLVTLRGDVHLVQKAEDTAHVLTETLRVYPAQRFAETADPVTIDSARGSVQAVGMEASLANERILLRSEVRGTYAP